MKFSCPTCGIHLQAEADTIGKTVKCPGCSTKIQIPEPPAPTRDVSAPVDPGVTRESDDAEAADTESGATKAGSPPPPSLSTPGSQAADELVDDFYDQLPELNTSKVPQGPHPSHVNVWIAMGVGLITTFIWILAMRMLPAPGEGEKASAAQYLHALFLERGWSQYVTTFLMFWCLALLVLKFLNLRKQQRAMLIEALPSEISEEISLENLPEFHEHVINFPEKLRNTYIVNRIRKALEFFYVRQNNPEVAQMITSQSEIDAAKVAGSYSIVKVFLWAIPIMGFIGTVIGIGSAIAGFEDVLGAGSGEGGGEAGVDAFKEPLLNVLSSLGVAFDTTLLALVFSIVLSFPASSLQNSEDDLVTNVDEYCIDHLLKRLNDGGAGTNVGSEAGLLKAIGDAIANSQKELVVDFQRLQGKVAEVHDKQVKYYQEVAATIDKQLLNIDTRAKNYEKRLDNEFFTMLKSIETGSIHAIEGQVKPLAEGIGNLNEVLKQLDGKQVVVKKKGLFSRG